MAQQAGQGQYPGTLCRSPVLQYRQRSRAASPDGLRGWRQRTPWAGPFGPTASATADASGTARVAGSTGDPGPCPRDQAPAASSRRRAAVEPAQVMEPGGKIDGKPAPGNSRRARTADRRTKGNQRRTPDAGKPEDGGRRGQTRRANGKPEESPREPGGREIGPQTTR